jgi:hypothetical protein
VTRPHQVLALVVIAVLAGAASCQAVTHEVVVTIPDFFGIRIVGAGAGPQAVLFDYVDLPYAYLQAVEGDGRLLPTSVNRFADIEVNIRRNGRWYVGVIATPLIYVGPSSANGLALGDITVTPGARSGLTQRAVAGPGGSATFWTSWGLSTTEQRFASSTRATIGWQSLGFNGYDYELTVRGDAAPGTHTTTVTYVLTAP